MKINKFVFVIANTTWFGKRYWQSFPYTVGLLSAVLIEKGYKVEVIDANLENLTEEGLKKKIEDSKPDIVGISALTVEYRRCVHKSYEVVKSVDSNIKTVMGGVYPTLSLEIAIKDENVDYFVCGEGEERLVALVKAIEFGKGFDDIDGLSYSKNGESGYTTSLVKNSVDDLDKTPFPDYSVFDMKKYMFYGQKCTQNFQFRQFPVAATITSRGCPYKCIFCSSNRIYGLPIRYRSAQNVLAEIDMLVKDYGVREMIFVDDSFLQSKSRAKEIMRGLIDRKYDLLWKSNNLAIFHMDDEILDLMKESGCYQLSVSIESGNPKTLKLIKKPLRLDKIQNAIEKIKELDIELISNFVIGFPGETIDDIRVTFKYAEEIDIDYVLFSVATPLPATELYETSKKMNYLPPDFNFETFEYYGFGRGVITTKEFTPFELQVLRAYEWDRINFKTEQKKIKIAKMLGITMEELEKWRIDTRRSVGVDVKSVN